MNYDISKVRVSIDHITVTSEDFRVIWFDKDLLKPLYTVKRLPVAKEDSKKDALIKGYKHYYRYQHKKTNNIVKVFVERRGNNFLPNIVVQFNSSWEHNLTLPAVVEVLNLIIERYNVAFNLASFHLAIDLFSKINYVKQLAGCTLSRRRYDPPEDPKYPGTFNFHKYGEPFRLVLYDKKQQLLNEKLDVLSAAAIRRLEQCEIARYEFRVINTKLQLATSLKDLAIKDFCKLFMGEFIKFLQPNESKLAKYGLKPTHWEGMGLKAIRDLLSKNGIKNNFFRHMEKIPYLTNLVREALDIYEWCQEPEKYPLEQSKIVIRDLGIRFKEGKWKRGDS